jgi:hypothetical protein
MDLRETPCRVAAFGLKHVQGCFDAGCGPYFLDNTPVRRIFHRILFRIERRYNALEQYVPFFSKLGELPCLQRGHVPVT